MKIRVISSKYTQFHKHISIFRKVTASRTQVRKYDQLGKTLSFFYKFSYIFHYSRATSAKLSELKVCTLLSYKYVTVRLYAGHKRSYGLWNVIAENNAKNW